VLYSPSCLLKCMNTRDGQVRNRSGLVPATTAATDHLCQCTLGMSAMPIDRLSPPSLFDIAVTAVRMEYFFSLAEQRALRKFVTRSALHQECPVAVVRSAARACDRMAGFLQAPALRSA
jgi:hypothetical protein